MPGSHRAGHSGAPGGVCRDSPTDPPQLTGLKGAATALENADHDKGGHRAKALELTRAAIGEVEAGIKFDNKH